MSKNLNFFLSLLTTASRVIKIEDDTDEDIKILLTKCLEKNADKRITSTQLVKNRWLFKNNTVTMNTLTVF